MRMAGGAKKWVELGGGFSMPVKAGGEGEERGRERERKWLLMWEDFKATYRGEGEGGCGAAEEGEREEG